MHTSGGFFSTWSWKFVLVKVSVSLRSIRAHFHASSYFDKNPQHYENLRAPSTWKVCNSSFQKSTLVEAKKKNVICKILLVWSQDCHTLYSNFPWSIHSSIWYFESENKWSLCQHYSLKILSRVRFTPWNSRCTARTTYITHDPKSPPTAR